MSDNVKVRIGTLEDMGQRFIDAWHRAKRGEAVSETHITLHDLPRPTAGPKAETAGSVKKREK